LGATAFFQPGVAPMLTDSAIRNIKPAKKSLRVFDGSGLYLEVSPSGGKWWRFKYRFQGKEKRISLGVYPEIGLKKARELREYNRTLVAEGIDPSENKKSNKSAYLQNSLHSFETVAREWLAKHGKNWVASHVDRTLSRLERDLFPWLGKKSVAVITPFEILVCVRRIEDRGALETSHRALQNCGQIFRYAVATGRAERNPTVDLKGALPPVKENHFSAITDPKKVGELLRVLDSYEGTFIIKCALRLAPLVFVRPGELRQAEWKDFNFEKSEWSYFVSKTKSQHIVPLSSQAIQILNELKPLTDSGRFVFPSAISKQRPMSDNAILSALRRLGIPKDEMTGHGFRAMARTILDEVLGFRPDYIEHQLAHSVRDPNGRAYNRTAHLHQRHHMMQSWSDYLESLKVGGSVLTFKKAKDL
jgi:integrase